MSVPPTRIRDQPADTPALDDMVASDKGSLVKTVKHTYAQILALGGGGSPTGAAGGDLGGTYPNPTVTDDSHSHTVATLPSTMPPSAHGHPTSDIVSGVLPIARLATGTPNGAKFIRDDGVLATPPTVPSGAAGGDLSGTYPNPSVQDDSHAHTTATLPATMPPSAHTHPASDITSGTVALARLPTIPTSQVSGLAASATTDTTNASNIGSGTLAAARVATLNQDTTGSAASLSSVIVRDKTSPTSRSATTTPTNDPDLVTPSSLPIGRYKVVILLFISCHDTTIGFQSTVAGTATLDDFHFIEQAWDGVGDPLTGIGAGSGGVLLSGDLNFSARIEGVISISVAGTVAVSWAQLVSGVGNSQLLSLSTMTVEKLS